MTHSQHAENYCRDVISGRIPACKWVRLACERHLRDLESSKNDAFPYRFDAQSANRFCHFAELMPHTKGKWCHYNHEKGEWNAIKLEPWQQFIGCSLFGWVRKSNNKRRFKVASIYVPRKNAKSTLAACIGLYMLVMDGEAGAEVYAGATTQAQAMVVHKMAWLMIKKSPELIEEYGISVSGETIPGPILLEDGSKFEAVIGNPGDGSSPHCSIVDEYHEHKTSDLYDTMATGMGAREQPLQLVISTAGDNLAGPCREDWKSCEKLLTGTSGFQDDTKFAIIWTVDDEIEWLTMDGLQKANPNWGISINPEVILPAIEAAKSSPRLQAAVKTKHFNLWVASKSAYFNVETWRKLADPSIKPEDFKDFPCYLPADLAAKSDLSVLMFLFCLPDKRYALFGKYYLPEETIQKPENQHYTTWTREGWITKTEGAVTDLYALADDAEQACKDFQVQEIPMDPARAWLVHSELTRRGLPVIEYRNTVLMMSEPMKELGSWIDSGRIVHNGDPVLEWAISNVVAKMDQKENVFPNKETPQQKIDPVVAAIFGVGRAMIRPDDDSPKDGFYF